MMVDLPGNVTYGTVTGQIVYAVADTSDDPDSEPNAVAAAGTVMFTPKVGIVKDSAAKTVMIPAQVVCPIDLDGYLTSPGFPLVQLVTLVAADNPAINPRGWSYIVSFNLTNLPPNVKLDAFEIVVLGGVTIDLADAIPVSGSPLVSVAQSVALAAQAAASAALAAASAEAAIDASDAGAAAAEASAVAAANQATFATTAATASAASAAASATSVIDATTQAGTATTQAGLSTAAQAAIAAAIGGMAIVATVPAPGNMVLFAVVDTAGHLSWIQVGLDGHPTPAAATLIDAALATLTTNRITAITSALPVAQIITDGPGLAYVITDSAGRKSEMQLDLKTGRFVGPFIDRINAIAGAAGAAAAASVVNTATVPVACWGDSMTASGSGYGTLLSTELGAAVRVYGIGGQGPANIAARQGGIPACGTFPSNTIPASGSVTLTSITVPPYTTPNGVTTSSGHVTIAAVPGVLTRDDVTGIHTFVRDTPGVAVWCPPSTPMYTDEALLNRGQIVVIWSGRNGVLTTTPDEIVFDIQMMINYLNSTAKRFLVMEVSPIAATETNGTADRVKLDALNALLHRTWPHECLTNAQYMRGPALADSGLTPTSQDTTDLSNGVVPSSLSTDGTHYNLTGRTLIAKFVSNAIKAKGWV